MYTIILRNIEAEIASFAPRLCNRIQQNVLPLKYNSQAPRIPKVFNNSQALRIPLFWLCVLHVLQDALTFKYIWYIGEIYIRRIN